jgi:Arc/MetJ-type ribon-helix-helix transcriptional regulator
MMNGMTTTDRPKAKITVSLSADLVEQLQRAAGRGEVASVSAFVERAVREQLTAEAEWGDELARILEESGGPLTDEERACVDSLVPPCDNDQ